MINVALFGFGRIGQMHAENLNKNKEIKLIKILSLKFQYISELTRLLFLGI